MSKRQKCGSRILVWAGVMTCLLGVGPLIVSQADESPIQRMVREGQVILPAQLQPGMRGVGRSVFRGTKIESFNVEVLGVLEKANSGGDVVLIKILDGPVVERKTGIIAGMSGSPVYIQGKLLGAIAFGWSFAREPIGGVTPIGDMLRSLDGAAGDDKSKKGGEQKEVQLPQPLSVEGQHYTKAIVLPNTGQSAKDYRASRTICLEPVQNLLLVSGFRSASLNRLGKLFEPYGLTPVLGPGASEKKVEATLEPGAAVCAQLVRGDLDMSAVGTVTYRDGDQILAFGHPFLGVGELNLPMTNAWVHEIFPSENLSFKLASPGQSQGAVTQDWAWAIGGRLGVTSPMVPVTIDVIDKERKSQKTYHVEVANQKDLLPELILNSAIEATYAIYGLQTEDSVKISLNIESDGLPPIRRENLYYGDGYAVISAVTELAQAVSVLTQNEFQRAKITKVELRCEMERARRSARIKRIFANRTTIKPGDDVEIGVAIEPYAQPLVIKKTTFTVPKDTPAGMMWIGVGSGMDELMLRARMGLHIAFPTNLPELLALYEQLHSNSDLVVKAALPRYGVSVSGKDMPVLPASVFQVMRSSRSTDVRPTREQMSQTIPTDWTIDGIQFLSVRIDSKKKPPQIAESGPREPGMDETPDQPPSSNEPPVPSDSSSYSQDLMSGARLPRADVLRFLDALGSWQSSLPLSKDGDRDKVPPADSGASRHSGNGDDTASDDNGSDRDDDPAPNSASSGPSSSVPEMTPITADKPIGRLAKTWSQSSVPDFLSGTMTNVAVTNKGDIRLAPESKSLFRSDELYFWTVAADPSGNAYVGTGNEGKIFKITPDGKADLLCDTSEVAITQLTFVPGKDSSTSGVLYAAGCPGGTIYRIGQDKQLAVFAKLPVPFIWCVVFDADGNLFAGTGPKGQIYKVRPDGTAETFTVLPQDHVRCLAVGGKNTLYAGTGDTGVVYRIRLDDRSIDALYNSSTGEITSLVADASGSLYLGTAGKAGVYQIDATGGVKTIYEPKLQAVYDLLLDGNNLYAATGDSQKQGIVYRMNVNGDGAVNRILEAEQGQILGIALAPEGRLLACTGNGAALHVLKLPFNQTGTFESVVFDAKVVARWGQVRWQAALPAGTAITVETRTGNTKIADESWSPWSVTYSDPEGASIGSPVGRYIQYRCHLKGSAAESPILERIELVYLTQNQAPTVAFKTPKGGEHWSGDQTLEWIGKDPDSDTLTYELLTTADSGATWTPVKLKSTRSSSQSLDTKGMKDGVYRAKVVARDSIGNPVGGQSAEAISKPFVVDNSPPLLLFEADSFKKSSDRRVAGKAVALDDVSSITSAEFRVDDGEWKAAGAQDSMFDSRWEDINFEAEVSETENHTIELRTRDSAGNVATKKESLPSTSKPQASPKTN